MFLFHGGDLPGIQYIVLAVFVGYALVIGFGIGYLLYFFLWKKRK